MNRELKFRAWNGEKMIYDIVLGKFGAFYVNPGNKGNGLDENDSASLSPYNTKYTDSVPIMQFTGLHDRNGKEIYEGDIDKHYGKFSLGLFETVPGFGMQTWCFKHNTLVCDHEGKTNYEIIGNIYENPELVQPQI